jgi:hypothetical protein
MTPEQIETELKHLATKEDVAQLRAEMHQLFGEFKGEIYKWMIGLQLPTWIGIIGILVAILLRK